MRRNQESRPLKSPRFRIGVCDGELMSVGGGRWEFGLLISAQSGRGRAVFEQRIFAWNFGADGCGEICE
jgi:hypothetical protein